MIEKMERISLYGLTGDSRRIISEIMKCGCMQIEDPEQAPGYDEIKEDVRRRTVDVYDSEQFQNRLGQVMALLAPFSRKKGLLDPQKTASFAEMCGEDSRSRAEQVCQSVETVQREIGFLKGEVAKQEFLLSSLEPWAELDLPLDETETRTCQLLLAALPAAVSLEELVEGAGGEAPGAYITQVSEDTQQRYLAAVAAKETLPALWEFLRQKGASRSTFPGLTGTAAQNMAACLRQMEELNKSLAASQEMLAGFGAEMELLRQAYDSTQMKIDRARARQKMLHTDNTFFFQAWVPRRMKERVEETLAPFTCHYEFTQPEDGEEAPTLLKNNKFVEPFESITEMYSMPAYYGLDPDPVMAVFYFIFFGMMLSDAGYGLVLTIAGLWGAKHLNMGPGAKKMLKMFGYCGISTVFWGAIFGSWFGDAIPRVADVFFGKAVNIPTLINPLNDPMSLLILSFVLGYFHIMTGLALSAYMMIHRGKVLDALMDVGSWFLVLVGLPMMAAGMMLGGYLAVLGPIGQWMAIAGAVALVLTQGRGNKNIITKFLSGLLSLYNITGYFADVLSYSRIMALGLATGVIGQVVNTMGALPGKNIIGALLFIAVFLFGHLLNMAINVLGSYVHTARLQYVEFFGKFFEGGGKRFIPLRPNTKYIHIIKQEEH